MRIVWVECAWIRERERKKLRKNPIAPKSSVSVPQSNRGSAWICIENPIQKDQVAAAAAAE